MSEPTYNDAAVIYNSPYISYNGQVISAGGGDDGDGGGPGAHSGTHKVVRTTDDFGRKRWITKEGAIANIRSRYGWS